MSGRFAGYGMLLVALLSLSACQSEKEASTTQAIQLELDTRNPARILRYYFSAYMGPEGGDPFEAGILAEQSGTYYLYPEVLKRFYPAIEQALDTLVQGNTLSWDALKALVHRTYYSVRPLPPTLDAFMQEVPYGGEGWFEVPIHAVFTAALRKIYVPEDALRYALSHYQENQERLIYPVGTTIVGEHWMEDKRVEVTVMRKRPDSQWDFFIYDAETGKLSPTLLTPPRPLKVPVQCIGCHLGSKLFEPEKSFPAPAPPGPHGPRAIYVDDALKNPEVVRFFDEHRKRSDSVLGIYNTLFVSKLLRDREAGRLSAEDAALLNQLGL